MKISELHKNNRFAFILLLTGAVLAIIAGVGIIFNRSFFTSFSWIIFAFVGIIAIYMIYNINKILDEIRHSKESNNSK
ncbi:MAG TPA: hypothetical protein VGB37_13990 [Candidatus Lokiarchaeia archaeon]